MLEDENESMYEGEWDRKRNIIDGRGVKIWKDGARYEGMWKNNKHHGYGRIIYPDGEFYVGEWKNNVIEGMGLYTYSYGKICEGQWADGILNGRGKEITNEYEFDGTFYKG